MTAQARTFGPRIDAEEERRWFHRPREGWAALALLLIMLATMAFAIDEANWAGPAPRGGQQTGFLPWAALLGCLAGFILAKSPLPTFAAHVAGAATGAGFLLIAAANAISDLSSLPARLRDLNESMTVFYEDLVVLGIRSAETSAFLLIIGSIVWGVGQFAAFNLFRRSRAMPGVVCAGLALLINMSITIRLQYLYLIAFAAVAMLLLVRMNLLTQQEGWRRRRIGDVSLASGIFMRGGATFVGLTLVGAITLAATASSAPLANAWRELDDQLLTIGGELNRIIGGVTGAARGPAGLFGSSQTISGIWESSSEIVFRSTASDGEPHYWRGATYDRFDGYTWQQVDRQRVDVPAGQELLAASSDTPAGLPGMRPVHLTLTSVALAGGALLSPATPFSVDRDASLTISGDGGPMATIDLRDAIDPGESYTVLAQVPETTAEGGAITVNDLVTAGVQYEFWARRYVDITPGSITSLVDRTAERIVADLPESERDPYHVADAIEGFLHDEGDFTYTTNVLGLCGRDKTVDCFLRTKRGYCEQFATTMVMMLRTQEIPARLALGFLPGREISDGTWEVARSAAHAWVEVYFPGYGWVRFDPTPGNFENGQQATELDPGAQLGPDASPPPQAAPTFATEPIDPNQDISPGEGRELPGGAQVTRPPAVGPLAAVVVAGIALAVVVLVVFARRRRIAYTEPDVAYRSVARLAGRFGYGPKPTQTAYEYAGALGEILPSVRTELAVVARAKVETTYARRDPSAELLVQLRAAYRRVRLGLLRLVFKRRRRRSGPTSVTRR